MTRALPIAALLLAAGCTPLGTSPVPGREVIYGFLDEGDVAVADALLGDCWMVAPRFDVHCFDGLPAWDEDPFDERYWRFVFYSLRPTTHLLAAWSETGDVSYADKLVEILDSYDRHADQSPFMDDRHGTAFRAMVLVNSYRKLDAGGLLSRDLANRLRRRIRGAGTYLANDRNFEGDYNHGVNQAAALLLVSQEFPPATAPSEWEQLALGRLEGVLEDVLYSDGVLVEQSPGYHLYVLSHLFQIDDWGRRFDVPLPSELTEATAAMADFAAQITQPDGWLPLIGSTDEKHLATYDVSAFDRIAEQSPTLRYVRTAGADGEPPARSALFPDSGQFVARSGLDPGEEEAERTHLVFDMGDAPASHAQLDALSLHLYARGRRLLVDSGMYTYEAGAAHDYFWSTRAHNTVVVDGVSQSRAGGIPVGSVEGEDWIFQSGLLDGLNPGVMHRRGVLLLDRDAVLVLDELDSEATHTYTQTWHLFPGAAAEASAEGLGVVDEDGATALRILQGEPVAPQLAIFDGSEDPMQGWYSGMYEILEPAVAVEYRLGGQTARFATLLLFGTAVDGGAISRDASTGGLQITAGSVGWWVSVDDLAGPGEQVLVSHDPGRATQ